VHEKELDPTFSFSFADSAAAASAEAYSFPFHALPDVSWTDPKLEECSPPKKPRRARAPTESTESLAGFTSASSSDSVATAASTSAPTPPTAAAAASAADPALRLVRNSSTASSSSASATNPSCAVSFDYCRRSASMAVKSPFPAAFASAPATADDKQALSELPSDIVSEELSHTNFVRLIRTFTELSDDVFSDCAFVGLLHFLSRIALLPAAMSRAAVPSPEFRRVKPDLDTFRRFRATERERLPLDATRYLMDVCELWLQKRYPVLAHAAIRQLWPELGVGALRELIIEYFGEGLVFGLVCAERFHWCQRVHGFGRGPARRVVARSRMHSILLLL
jgi:hypothetical protein